MIRFLQPPGAEVAVKKGLVQLLEPQRLRVVEARVEVRDDRHNLPIQRLRRRSASVRLQGSSRYCGHVPHSLASPTMINMTQGYMIRSE